MAIKKVLLSVLGEKRYLALLSGTFQRLYRTGLLGKEYQDVYFLRKLIKPGDYCIDIGAHLGYYTIELSRLTGDRGKVFAVEPMTPFRRTLEDLLQRKKAGNVTLYQVALGGSGEYVEMGIPRLGDTRRFAFARIKENNDHLEFVGSEKVKNESGDRLFLQLPRVDYIKCDVEGFEYQVFASMVQTLETHRPMLLCELFDRALLIRLFELLQPFDYRAYTLDKDRLVPLEVYAEGQIPSQNYYFLPSRREDRFRTFIG
ncbi:MAG TPA: FkbM family methyltransferase [Puia sp.]|jgi:FkbM family methyltransferase|nr:FkbM family methyltransferase [Puia sp.]